MTNGFGSDFGVYGYRKINKFIILFQYKLILNFKILKGNKGANICAINIGLLNFTLVNSHLSAHQEQDKTRLIVEIFISFKNNFLLF